MSEDYSEILKDEMRPSLKISITAIMTVLVCVVTMMISVYLPTTYGFFNIGESMVYVSAILFGPYVGGISGGVGSMLADLFLGYAIYAPGTLIIKGIEGFMVGYFYYKMKKLEFSQNQWRILTMIYAFIINLLVIVIGYIFYLGTAEIGIFYFVFESEVYLIMWVLIGIIGFVSIVIIGYKFRQDVSLKIIAMLIGGLIIVSGYLLYATFILQNAAAYTEIPFNFLQCFIGILISIPTISALEKYSGVIAFIEQRK